MRSQNDKFGEQIFNIEEKNTEFEKYFKDMFAQRMEGVHQQLSDAEQRTREQMAELESAFTAKITEEIDRQFPRYNIHVMNQVNELVDSTWRTLQQDMGSLRETQETKLQYTESKLHDIDMKMVEEKARREQEARELQSDVEMQMKDFMSVIDIKFQKKQKTKVDFMIEIRNMHK